MRGGVPSSRMDRGGRRSGAATRSTRAAKAMFGAGSRYPIVSSARRAGRFFGQVLEDLVPALVGPLAGGLGDVAHDRHRTVERTPLEHAQLHRRQVLGFVDDDVAVRARLVVGFGRPAAPGLRAQDGSRLVEQRCVVVREDDLVTGLATRAVQRVDLVRVEYPATGAAQQGARAEQVVQKIAGREHRPHPLERLANARIVPQTVTNLAGVEVAASAGRQRREELGVDELAGRVVTAIAAARLVDDASALLAGEAKPLQSVAENEVGAQATTAITHRSVQHPSHAQIALDARGRAAVVSEEPRFGHEVGEDRELDTGLAERRQHLFDVAEEQPVGPDDEHALAFERKAMGVEQVRGAMERHHGLTGARVRPAPPRRPATRRG